MKQPKKKLRCKRQQQKLQLRFKQQLLLKSSDIWFSCCGLSSCSCCCRGSCCLNRSWSFCCCLLHLNFFLGCFIYCSNSPCWSLRRCSCKENKSHNCNYNNNS